MFDHAGLLVTGPPGKAESLFIQSSDDFKLTLGGAKAKLATAPQPNATVWTEKGKWIIVLARRLRICRLDLPQIWANLGTHYQLVTV